MTETTDHATNQELRSDLEDVYGRYEELRSGVDELQRSVATMQVSAESANGAVQATVDSAGQLVGLRLDQQACQTWDADTLARTIVETVQHASAGKSQHIEQIVTNHRPPDGTA